MGKIITITRKIRLLFDVQGKEELKECYTKLGQWQRICHRVANMISSHQFMMENQRDLIYIREEAKVKLANYGADPLGILNTSRQNSTYQMASKNFKGEIPTSILTSLNSVIIKTFNKEQKEYFLGTKSLRSYKSTIPIPIQSVNITKLKALTHTYEKKVYHNYGFSLYGIPFKTMFAADRQGNLAILEKFLSAEMLPAWLWENEDELSEIIKQKEGHDIAAAIGDRMFTIEKVMQDDEEGFYYKVTHGMLAFKMAQKVVGGAPAWRIVSDYRLADSSIQLKGNKIFLLATFQFESSPQKLDENIKAECWLGLDIPIEGRVGDKTFEIGSKDDFLFRRVAIQASMRNKQRAIKGNLAHGRRTRKLQALKQYEGKEHRYVESKIHQYSKKLIQICLKYGCRTIILKDQIEKEAEAKKDEAYLLRNWSYYDLKTKIAYKAQIVGIKIEVL